MEIQFNNFKRQYSRIEAEVNIAIKETLESGNFILGEKVKQFEAEFTKYIGSKFCVGVASGTDAITLALMASGIGESDEVITTNITAWPTVVGIIRAGATPIVVDIDTGDGLIDCEKIEEKITGKTKAIVPVHLYGQSADMKKITEITARHNLKIIEDCAQSTGATFGDRKIGAIGDCGAFSFYPTKNLGAYGDGGAVVTSDQNVYEKLISLRNYGKGEGYNHKYAGINSRLDEMQAAILSAKMKHLDGWNRRRREIAAYYKNNLKTVEPLLERNYGKAAFHLFIVKNNRRNELRDYLKNNGIQTLIHYPLEINNQEAFKWQKGEEFKNSNDFVGKILSVPLYPELTDEEVQYAVKIINDFN